ncbi:MEMO1 family [Kalaharituber pfeilii]|nr:MEMO1 family [Kalaharituber pfeilii]
MPGRTERRDTHAGSWYTDVEPTLDRELEGWLNAVPNAIEGVGDIPHPGARVIIAPHAGYSYSGPPAAWAYKALNVSKAYLDRKRVFILGPSHHHYFEACAVSPFTTYATPLGSLIIDKEINERLLATGAFTTMKPQVDEDEHSIEMHLPYVYKVLERHFGKGATFPKIVPILVGAIDAQQESSFGKLLRPYLEDEENCFVISSDFCHWGTRFAYTYYLPNSSSGTQMGYSLKSNNCPHPPSNPPIWSSIETLDKLAIESIETGNHSSFTTYLQRTKNTVCGRHPIGVIMAALQGEEGNAPLGTFKFIRYEQSSKCFTLRDSSVSYASAFAVLS